MELGGRVALACLALWAGLVAAAPLPPGKGTRAPPAAQALAEPAPRVVAVELQLPAGSDARGLAELVAVRPGRPLSPREVRRAVERLWRTGRFLDVVVRTVPEQGGVRVVFALTPVLSVVHALVEGNTLFEDRKLLEVAGYTGPERARAPERLKEAEAAVVRLYASRGYDAARVQTRIQPVQGGVELVLEVAEGPVTRVADVSFGGEQTLPRSALLEAFGLVPGGALDRTRLETGVDRLRTLLRERGWYTAQVDEPVERAVEDGVHLIVPVQAGPRFRLRFRGNRTFSSALLEEALQYRGEEALERGMAERLARRLQAWYRSHGYLWAQVVAQQEVSPDKKRALLTFEVSEDLPWRVASVTFEGRQALGQEELEALLAEQVRARLPSREQRRLGLDEPLDAEGRTRARAREGLPPAEAVYVEQVWQEGARALGEAYRQRGFLEAQVSLDGATLSPEARTVAVRFRVEEGPRTLVEAVRLEGLPQDVPTEGVPLPVVGQPFNPALAERGRAALGRALSRRGYLFGEVAALTQGGKAGGAGVTRVDVVYRVVPGPQVRVGKVLVQGLERSSEDMVRSNLVLREGAVLDPEQLFESQRNLVLLGLFRQVAVRMVAPEVVDAAKDVLVEVRERPRAQGDVGLGYFFAEGPRLLIDTTLPNLGGSGYSLQGRLRANYVTWSTLPIAAEYRGLEGVGASGNVGLLFPRYYLAPFQLGMRLDGVGERVLRSAFDFNRLAAIWGVDGRASWFTLNLQAELEQDQVSASDATQLLTASETLIGEQRVRFPAGSFLLWSARATATADLRDDPANTRRGGLFSLSAELVDDLAAEFRDTEPASLRTLKLAFNISGYLPLGERVVLAGSLRGGDILPLVDGAQSIAPRRFFLGGASSMRGFREDGVLPADVRFQLSQDRDACRALVTHAGCSPAAALLEDGRDLRSGGGNRFALAKLELRLPSFLFRSVDLGLFGEAGNLWEDPRAWEPFDLRYVAGTGLRVATPVGPVAFDVGFNLFPDETVNEQAVNVHFSVGLF